jgi:hypothetical protein
MALASARHPGLMWRVYRGSAHRGVGSFSRTNINKSWNFSRDAAMLIVAIVVVLSPNCPRLCLQHLTKLHVVDWPQAMVTGPAGRL